MYFLVYLAQVLSDSALANAIIARRSQNSYILFVPTNARSHPEVVELFTCFVVYTPSPVRLWRVLGA